MKKSRTGNPSASGGDLASKQLDGRPHFIKQIYFLKFCRLTIAEIILF